MGGKCIARALVDSNYISGVQSSGEASEPTWRRRPSQAVRKTPGRMGCQVSASWFAPLNALQFPITRILGLPFQHYTRLGNMGAHGHITFYVFYVLSCAYIDNILFL